MLKTHRRTLALGAIAFFAPLAGCTSESTRIALETQRRADDVQQRVFDEQHEALRVLSFRDTLTRMNASGEPLSGEQTQTLNRAWNDRDLMEFWAVQQERARALRLVGVDTKLFADQSPIDLLLKRIDVGLQRAEAANPPAPRSATQPATPTSGGAAE